jgi:hypothetical protein
MSTPNHDVRQSTIPISNKSSLQAQQFVAYLYLQLLQYPLVLQQNCYGLNHRYQLKL